jgi:integrase
MVSEFGRLIKAAGVRRIKFHGLRHTTATLMLAAGVPPHVVQRRLGHSKVEMTLGIYAHPDFRRRVIHRMSGEEKQRWRDAVNFFKKNSPLMNAARNVVGGHFSKNAGERRRQPG